MERTITKLFVSDNLSLSGLDATETQDFTEEKHRLQKAIDRDNKKPKED